MKRKNKKQKLVESIKDLEFKDFILPQRMKLKYNGIEFSNGIFSTYIALKVFPKKTNTTLLLKDIGALKGVSILMDMEELQLSQFEKQLVRTTQNDNESVKNNEIDKVKHNVNVGARLKLVEEIYNDNQKTYRGTILLKLSCDSLEELTTLQKTVKSKLSARSILADNLFYRMKQAYTSFMPFNKDELHDYIEHPYSAKTYANLWIPNYASWIQSKGYPLGKIDNGGAFFFDPFERNRYVSNANGYIFGKSGRGKSNLLKMIIFNSVLDDKNVIILDPNDEYVDLITGLGGYAMDIPKLNVMHVRELDDEVKQKLENDDTSTFSDFRYHLNFLRTWYMTYAHDTANKEDKCFEFLCKMVYNEKQINEDSNFLEIKDDEYPRLRDVYDMAIKHSQMKLRELIEEGIIWKPDQFLDVAQSLQTAVYDGSDAQYFDIYTQAPMDTSKQIIVSIQLKSIEKLMPNTKSALYLNMNSYITSLVLQDRTTQYVYGWDEQHMAVDKRTNADNQAIKDFATVVAIARKFEVSMWGATTSPQHLLHPSVVDSTTTILSQCSFKFLFQTVDDDYTALSEMLSGLNSVVKEKIQTLPPYQCIVSIGENLYFKLKVLGVNLNKLTGNEDDYLLDVAKLFGTAGGR